MEAVSNESPVMEQVAHASPVPVHGSKPPGVCTHSECGERRGWACAYKDLMGRECKSWWCRRHITFIERTPFCPRHASVIRALAPTAGTIFEIKNRPAVDDRALPLAALVAEDIDKDVTELVRRRYQNRKDVVLATDKTVRQTWAGRNEVADRLALPFSAVEPILKSLTTDNFLDALGLANEQGPWLNRPLPERMAYALTKQGRVRSEEIARASTRYAGPAPVSMSEYRTVLAEAAKPGTLDMVKVNIALAGIELAPGVAEAVRAAVNSRSSIFIYGAPGNGKTTLARRISALLGGPIIIPVALDIGGGEVMTVFDGAVHRLETNQPVDRRWRRIARPLVQVGGEFQLEMFDPTWEEGSRTYGAPLQMKANGGVLLIDDLGRQRVAPKQILDRLLVPLEQEIDYMNLASSGRKVEVPFWCQLALSTNLKPGELLDEAYLRRLAYKVLMPDPTWDMWCRIFERERERLTIPPNPSALDWIRQMYAGRPLRGNHPRDLLERLVDVSSARSQRAELSQELVQAAWQTLFIAG